MKHSIVSFLFILSILIDCSACSKNEDRDPGNINISRLPNTDAMNSPDSDTTSNRLKITVGSTTFNATLVSNPTVEEFKKRLPMTINMSELNGNEKLFKFSTNLPADAANPGTINKGDLMLYGSNVLVLFYQTFPTSYSYTKLGRIDNTTGLTGALGTGSVTVTFALQ